MSNWLIPAVDDFDCKNSDDFPPPSTWDDHGRNNIFTDVAVCKSNGKTPFGQMLRFVTVF